MNTQKNSSQAPQVLTVSQLTQAIKKNLEENFPSLVVQGEVSNFRAQSSGHLYFSLKDADAQISCVMFRGSAQHLKVLPKDGDKVIVKGDLNVYPPRGNYQLLVRDLSQVGLGELLMKLEELKRKIHARGWFSRRHKKPLPAFPKIIGVVTSPTGAALQDILNVLGRRRRGGFHLILNPVKVQGEGAAEEIARAIEEFNKYSLADVLIVGRGGGSIEDLWAFNEETVATAIFESRIPIIAAVGHETDHCIAEYVADVRAPTPSAAAEIVIAEASQQELELFQLRDRLTNAVRQRISYHRQHLSRIMKMAIFRSVYPLLGPWIQKIDDLKNSCDRQILQKLSRYRLLLSGIQKQAAAMRPLTRIRQWQQKLHNIHKHVHLSISQYLRRRREEMARVSSNLQSIDPKNLLKRGYSILFNEKDLSVINSVRKLRTDQIVKVLFSDGEARAAIKEIAEKKSIEKKS